MQCDGLAEYLTIVNFNISEMIMLRGMAEFSKPDRIVTRIIEKFGCYEHFNTNWWLLYVSEIILNITESLAVVEIVDVHREKFYIKLKIIW